jgi:hypothetical protein
MTLISKTSGSAPCLCAVTAEIWFSILARQLLKLGSFESTDELGQRILGLIEYFNNTPAKPFKWTCEGRPLMV